MDVYTREQRRKEGKCASVDSGSDSQDGRQADRQTDPFAFACVRACAPPIQLFKHEWLLMSVKAAEAAADTAAACA